MIRKITLAIAIASLIHLSCERETQTPTIDAPEGIKQVINNLNTNNCYCEYYIDRYHWQSDTVYLLSCRGRAGRQPVMMDECDCMPGIYNKSGVYLSRDSTFPLRQVMQEIQFIDHVWKCAPQ